MKSYIDIKCFPLLLRIIIFVSENLYKHEKAVIWSLCFSWLCSFLQSFDLMMLCKHAVSLPFFYSLLSLFKLRWLQCHYNTYKSYLQENVTVVIRCDPSTQKLWGASSDYRWLQWIQVISDLTISWCLSSKMNWIGQRFSSDFCSFCLSAFAHISSTQCNFLCFGSI